jgi:8-oxo-dGTP pyrophosphatase MutT (NUDIX family)
VEGNIVVASDATSYAPSAAQAEHIKTYLRSGQQEIASPALASTVMLVRAGGAPEERSSGAASEVFMLRRARSMSFVPDAFVFPGGRIDESDHHLDAPWRGPSAQIWAQRIGCTPEVAVSLITAAMRELLEESGVLLGDPDELSGLSYEEARVARRRLSCHEISFASFLRENDITIRSDLLGLRAHWVTPEFEPRRYDTLFFAARLPEGQTADGDTSEASAAGWVMPAQIIAASKSGTALLMPPTLHNLRELCEAPDLTRFVAGSSRVPRVMLVPEEGEDGEVLLRYGSHE